MSKKNPSIRRRRRSREEEKNLILYGLFSLLKSEADGLDLSDQSIDAIMQRIASILSGFDIRKSDVPWTRGTEHSNATSSEDDILARIQELLLSHLGSTKAVDAWLDSPDTGYPTTARDAIKAGHAEYVLRDLESQWGPNPSYA